MGLDSFNEMSELPGSRFADCPLGRAAEIENVQMTGDNLVFEKESTMEYDEDHYGYADWLDKAGIDDTPIARAWYDCPMEESSKFMKEHRDWFETL